MAIDADDDRSRALLKDFGLNLKLERVKRRLNQREFATLLGLHRTFIGQLERGQRSCNLIEFMHIVETLQVQPQELLPRTVRHDEGSERIT